MNSLQINRALTKLSHSDHLLKQESRDVLSYILNSNDVAVNTAWGALFAFLDVKGPTWDELEGLFEACAAYEKGFFNARSVCDLQNTVLVVGSGKDSFKTINISTMASIVAAGAGVPVIKMVSASSSSGIGSRDLLDGLGIKVVSDLSKCKEALEKCGIVFIGIEEQIPRFNLRYQGAFFHFHTLSPYLGLMASPIQSQNVVLGLSRPAVIQAAEVVEKMGFKRAVVVSTEIDSRRLFADEILPTGRVHYARLCPGHPLVYHVKNGEEFRRPGSQFSLEEIRERTNIADLRRSFRDVLTPCREAGSAQEVVCLNSASILVAAGACKSLAEGAARSWEVLCSGVVLKVLDQYEKLSVQLSE